MTSIPTRLPWPELATTAPTLPGGGDSFVTTLVAVLEGYSTRLPTDLLADPDSADRIQKQLGPLGLTIRGSDGIELTALGRQWLADPNKNDLFQIMHSRLAYFGEALARLEASPADVEELREDATSRYLLSWTSLDQVRRRLAWLEALGLTESWPDRRFRITDAGKAVLATTAIATPDEVLAAVAVSVEPATLPTPPPLLARALQEATSTNRSLAWSYLTKDPEEALKLIAEAAAATTTKEELIDLLSQRYEISASSAKSAVDAAGLLGLYQFVGKREIAATPLGREWAVSASPINLVRLLHVRFLGFGEVLLHIDDEPRSAGEIHRLLFGNSDSGPRQDRTAGVLRYLAAAAAVASIGYARYVITGIGRELAQELPMVATIDAEAPNAGLQDSHETIEHGSDSLVRELELSARDSANPERFEQACTQAFTALGVEARHLGGPGRTDVLITIRSNLKVISRAIVDAKSAAGQLNEGSVKFDALKEHAVKHDATLMAVVAPGFDGSGRLADWARSNGVVLFTAAELGDLLRAHEIFPFSGSDVAALLTVDGREDVEAQRAQTLEQLALVEKVVGELTAEARQEKGEPIAARDIGRALRRSGTSASDDDVAAILKFLGQPEIAAVQPSAGGTFTLPSPPAIAAKRLRAMAQAIENASD